MATVRAGLRAALATPSLRRLELAWLVSATGGWAFMVALAIYAYAQGGAAAVGLAALARMVPAAVAAPFAGLLGDRHSRRNVLVAACVARAAALAAIGASIAAGAPLSVTLVLAALFTAIQTAHKPAQAALLPSLTRSPEQLAASNALSSATDNAAFVLGALVSGALVAALSVQATFFGTAAAFMVAAASLHAIPADPVPAQRKRSASTTLCDLAQGARTVAAERPLRLVVGLLTFAALVEGLIDVLVVVVAVQLVALGSPGVGWLNACWGIGGVVGGVAALALLERRRLAGGLALGGALVGVPLIVLGAAPALTSAVAALSVLGVGYALIEVAGMTLLQRLASDEVLARAFAVVESTYWLATGVGAVIAAPLVAVLGIRGALIAAGTAVALALTARWAALSRLETQAPVDERDFGLLRGVPFFAPVPLATVETLTRRLAIVAVVPGQTVIREGDPGDRFYVVARGTLRIDKRGAPCARARVGDYFGESALLLGCPRTASVTAEQPATLLALAREDFLQTVTGHRSAAAAAGAIVNQRRMGVA